MIILNLGCGTRTSSDPRVVNVDWSPYLMIRRSAVLRAAITPLLDAERRHRLSGLSTSVVAHDLRRGIPFADGSVDVVYHSHFLEHIDREVAPRFLAEVLRVLKPGGIHRVVVPDFLRLCEAYVRSTELAEIGEVDASVHERAITAILEQCVRQESAGTASKGRARRRLENLILGDARRRGETHQWMYDAISLCGLLRDVGFREPTVMTYSESAIPDWLSTGLDVEVDAPYKPGSLYVEAYR